MNLIEPRLLRVEVVADLPVLWATFERLDLPATLDRRDAREGFVWHMKASPG